VIWFHLKRNKRQEQNKVVIAEKGRAAESYKAPFIVELKERGDRGPAGHWKEDLSHYPPGPGWGDVRGAYDSSMDLSTRHLLRLYPGHCRGSELNLCLRSNYIVCYCFSTRPW